MEFCQSQKLLDPPTSRLPSTTATPIKADAITAPNINRRKLAANRYDVRRVIVHVNSQTGIRTMTGRNGRMLSLFQLHHLPCHVAYFSTGSRKVRMNVVSSNHRQSQAVIPQTATSPASST